MSNIEKIKESLLNNETRNEVFENSLVGNVFDIYEVSKVSVNHSFRDGVLKLKTIDMIFNIADTRNTRLSVEAREKLIPEIGNYFNEINMLDFKNEEEVDFLLKFIKDDLYNKFNKEANKLGLEYLINSYKNFDGNSKDEVDVRFSVNFTNSRMLGIKVDSLKRFVK